MKKGYGGKKGGKRTACGVYKSWDARKTGPSKKNKGFGPK